MTCGTCTSAVTMVTQSSNNPDYCTGPSLVPRLSVGVEKREPGIHCLCMHITSQKSWEIGNYISHLPFSVCTSSDQQWIEFFQLFALLHHPAPSSISDMSLKTAAFVGEKKTMYINAATA